MTEKNPIILLKCKNGNTLNSKNFADFAENQIAPNGTLKYSRLTTSKLRSIYGMITNIYSKINTCDSFKEYLSDLQHLKVKMAYECGRDDVVKDFIKGTFLMAAIDYIKDYDQFILYCRYAESLVAYFKFYGGKE